MSAPLEVTERKNGVEYHRDETTSVGAWNADASPGSLGKFDFSEIKNLRQVSMGTLTVRTPPKLHEVPVTVLLPTAPPTTVAASKVTVIGKCQYRSPFTYSNALPQFVQQYVGTLYPDIQFDVTLVFGESGSNGSYSLIFLEPGTGMVITVPVPEFGTQLLTGWIMQFKLSLIVTLKGHVPTNGVSDLSGGTWEVYPKLHPTTDAVASANSITYTDGLVVTVLGKDVCPTPSQVAFVTKTTGDLFVIDNDGSLGNDIITDHLKLDPNDPPNYLLQPLAINVDYWLNMGDAFSVNQPRYWVYSDPDNTSATIGSVLEHGMSRAWGYRFLMVVEYTDPRGNKYRVYTEPSVDLWVPDVTYGPAQWGPGPQTSALTHTFPIDKHPNSHLFRVTTLTSDDGTVSNALPSPTDLGNLQAAFFKIVQSSIIGLGPWPRISDPWYWTAKYLCYRSDDEISNGDSNQSFYGHAPYLVDVPASKLKKAPMTIFNWTDFGPSGWAANSDGTWTLAGVQGNIVSIEIYRTAHSESKDSDNAKKSPDFAPHSYHYLGSIKPGATFTDDIQDDTMLSGADPSQYEGYLRGQFSGNVETEYNNRLVIGDVVTDYKVLPPAISLLPGIGGGTTQIMGLLQAFWYIVDDSSGYSKTDVNNQDAPGPSNNVRFFAAYADQNGIISDAVEIPQTQLFSALAFNSISGADHYYASFVIPRGYNASVQSVILYRARWNGSTYDVVQLATAPCDTGTYISNNQETTTVSLGPGVADPTTVIPKAVIKRSEERGAIIYSEPNQEFFWPPLNSWIVHSFAPVTLLDSITGPLWVGTDQSMHLTDLGIRKEDETRYVGAVSRFASQKVNKIVVFLGAQGLMFAEASGVNAIPHSINTVILQYLQEHIPGQPQLANVKRASLGWLAERKELWLYLPSSGDLWKQSLGTPGIPSQALPHRLIIFRYAASGNVREARWLGSVDFLASVVCYEFDFNTDFALRDLVYGDWGTLGYAIDPNSFRSEQIILNQHVDGGLYAAYFDALLGKFFVVNNDDPTQQWQGATSLEKYWPMGAPLLRKCVREVSIRAYGKYNMTIANGQADRSGVRTMQFGALDQRVGLSQVIDTRSPMRKAVRGASYETTSTSPLTRFVTIPDANGQHTIEYESVGLDVTPINNHP